MRAPLDENLLQLANSNDMQLDESMLPENSRISLYAVVATVDTCWYHTRGRL